MNRNHLKLIACLSMLIDHIGYVIFPQAEWMRLVGRIAMPIFAFFIGEGCYYTRDRKKYFLRIFILGVICQAVYIIESIINGGDGGGYLNILFTFSLSVILCGSFLNAEKENDISSWLLFAGCFVGFYLINLLFDNSSELIGVNITLDYGFEGIVLPMCAIVSREERVKKIIFGAGVAVFAYSVYGPTELAVFALIPIALLMLYNGKPGKKNMNKFFYLFYPVHLGVIYLADIMINI